MRDPKYTFFLRLAIALIVLPMVGCQAIPKEYYSNPKPTYLPQIKYMKDGRGNCFAYTRSSTTNGYVVDSISSISCTSAGL
jgi:hypothetical protein